MLKQLSKLWSFEKQKNSLLRVIAFISLIFAGIYLILTIISGLDVTWTWFVQTSPTIEVFLFELVAWRIDRIILIIFCGITTILLVSEIGKKEEEDVPSFLVVIEDLIKIIGVIVIVCSIFWIVIRTISMSFLLQTNFPYAPDNSQTAGMFLPNISFGEMAIVLLLGIFSGLWIVPTALDMIKKKYSKRNNSLYLIMLIFFLFVLLAYIFETTLTNKQHVYLADYFLKFISYSWLGITSLWITKTKEKN